MINRWAMDTYIIKWRKSDGSIVIDDYNNLTDVTKRMAELSQAKTDFQVIYRA